MPSNPVLLEENVRTLEALYEWTITSIQSTSRGIGMRGESLGTRDEGHKTRQMVPI
jgi:hypothetical protein